MQPLSNDVFREVQQQGTREAEERGQRPRPTPEGERGLASRSSSAESQTSLPLSSKNGSPPKPSAAPPSSPFGESTSIYSKRRARHARQFFGASQEKQQPCLRSGARSRETSSTRRSSSSQTIPSQLLGGRPGANADVVMNDHPEISVLSIKDYQHSQMAITAAQLQSLLTSDQRMAVYEAPLHAIDPSLRQSVSTAGSCTRPPSPKQLPSPPASTHSASPCSEDSTASTLAYGLKRERPDMRLLKKSGIPRQHLRPALARSRHSEQPRVSHMPEIESHLNKPAVVAPAVPHAQSAPATLTIKALRRDSVRNRSASPKEKVLRKAGTFGMVSARDDQKPSTGPKHRPFLHKHTKSEISTSAKIATIEAPLSPRPAAPRQIRFDSPTRLPNSNNSIRLSSPSFPGTPKQNSSSSAYQRHRQRTKYYHEITPPVDDPTASARSYFSNGNHYFYSFPPDAMSTKEFMPMRSPPIEADSHKTETSSFFDHKASPEHGLEITGVPVDQHASPVFQGLPQQKRRRSSVLNIFQMIAPREGASNSTTPSASRRQTPQVSTPGIHVSTPGGRNRSLGNNSTKQNDSLPSCSFSNEPVDMPSSKLLLSPSFTSPFTGEDFETRRSHQRSSSEHVSPSASPRPTTRLRPQLTLENIRQDEDEGFPSESASRPAKRPRMIRLEQPIKEPTYQSVSSPNLKAPLDDRGIEITGSSLLALQKTRLSSIILQSNGMPLSEGNESTSRDVRGSRPDLLRKVSLSRPRLSRFRSSLAEVGRSLLTPQQRRSSCQDVLSIISESDREASGIVTDLSGRHGSLEHKISASDLQVTHFRQTSFVQRYSDSKWTAQQHIRSLVEDALNTDDENDDEVMLGFEHNVPDHLPTSPLCPLNPKHKSGGRAICPQHRKPRKTTRLSRISDSGANATDRGWQQSISGSSQVDTAANNGKFLKIVYDSSPEAHAKKTRVGSDGNVSPELEWRGRKRERCARGSTRWRLDKRL